MKLRTKLILSAVLIIVISVILCSLFAAAISKQHLLQTIEEAAVEKFETFYSDFSLYITANKELYSNESDNTLAYQFQQMTNSYEFVLQNDSIPIVNNTGIDPVKLLSAFLPKNESFSSYMIQAAHIPYNHENYFIVAKELHVSEKTYYISLVKNTTQDMLTLSNLTLKSVFVGFIVAVFASVLIFIFVSRSLKPIDQLRKQAREISKGNYHNRIALQNKDEIFELAEDFNAMAADVEDHIHTLQDLSERQGQFISALAHELKTPVTSLMLNSNTLLTRKVSQNDLSHALTRIYEQSRWLEQLSGKLTQLLLLNERVEKKQESVPVLFEAVRELVSEAFYKKGITLVMDCKIDTLFINFDLMLSAIVNLVNNSAKASCEGQSIELKAYHNTIEVLDHGSGIPKKDILHITEPFYMVDRSRNKKDGGMGLGLSLVQKIIEAHDCQLLINSEEQKGTTIKIIFPEAG